MRLLIASALILATPAFADETRGTVLAYDRKANVLILEDKTVWNLPATLEVPEDLVAGDVIDIEFRQAGDEGITAISSITRAE